MEILLYYILLVVVTGLSLTAASKLHGGKRHWELSPELVLVLSFFAYTSAMPFSRLLWGTDPEAADIPFMQAHLLAAFGILLGLVAGRLVNPPKPLPQRITPLPLQRSIILSSFALLLILGYIYYSVGYSFQNMLRPYAYESTVSTYGTTADTLIEPGAFALLLHCYLSALTFRAQRPKTFRYLLIIIALVTGALLLRGMRNPVQILCFPMFGLALRGRRIPVMKTAVAAISVFVLFSVVAAVRNFGVINADQVALTNSTLDPVHGELGTSYNVYKIFGTISNSGEFEYGRTYIVDLGMNLVPRFLWKNRPPSTAVRFSMEYYGTTDLKFGLGFSPVVESLMNFPVGGLPMVFGLIAYLIAIVANYLRARGRLGLLCYSMMLPMIVNWNRIDSSASFKMFAVYAGFFFVFDKLIYRRSDSRVLSSSPRLAPAALALRPPSGSVS